MASPVHITVSQLAKLIGTHKCPTIIDVRIDEDFNSNPRYIPTAIRCSHLDIQQLTNRLEGHAADRPIVVYCHKGLKLSEGAASILRTKGFKAEVLTGGIEAWKESALPLVPHSNIPERNEMQQTVWVTRLRPKIDRIACPWLIRRFIDPQAQFLFVSSSAVEAVAEKFNATAFDIENVFWSHRGEKCTFDTMVEEFELQSDALNRLATMVRAADTDRLELSAQAPGLLAASLGLSRMYSDDLEQLDAGIQLYDAFYRWCRDATAESHTWQVGDAKEGRP